MSIETTLKSCNSRQNKELVKQLMLEHREIAGKKDYKKQYKELIFNKYGFKPCDNFIKVNAQAIKNNTLTLNSNTKDQSYEYEYDGKIVHRNYKATNLNSCNLKENREKVIKYLTDNPDKRTLIQTELIRDIKVNLGIDVSLSALKKYIREIEVPNICHILNGTGN